MERLALMVMGQALFAIAITPKGFLRNLDDHVITRPIIVATGIALVVFTKEWGNWAEIQEWVMWFGVAAIPQVLRVAYLYFEQDRERALEQHRIRGTSHVERGT